MSIQVEGEIWQNELLTVREVATYLRVGRVTVWRWCQEGTIPASRLGRSWRIHRNDLSSFLEKRNLLGLDLAQSASLTKNHHQNHPLTIGKDPGGLEHGTVVYSSYET
jgi:excisionase family DNA binding protein